MKFLVLKIEDIEKYCALYQQEHLTEISNQIKGGRLEDGKKKDNRYLVVNTDEPYADEVRKIIEKHEGEKVTF